MMLSLENEFLKIAVSEKGAELQSIFGKKDQCEYLWQGDPAIWPDRAPNLFPYIARLTGGSYRYGGQLYHMQIHGLVMYSVLEGNRSGDELSLELRADNETYEQYPFCFVYRVRYQLAGSRVYITYEVLNQDEKTMYFGIGGHPGFSVPFFSNTEFEDYEVIFERDCSPEKIVMSEDCFVTGRRESFKMKDNKINLRHEMFDHDAIILYHAGHSVRVQNKKEKKGIMLQFPNMDYVGIWHRPHTRAPYLCVEPWSSLPSRKNVIEDLEKQRDLISLGAGEVYRNTWSITIL